MKALEPVRLEVANRERKKEVRANLLLVCPFLRFFLLFLSLILWCVRCSWLMDGRLSGQRMVISFPPECLCVLVV